MTGRKAKQHIDDRRDRALDLESHWKGVAERHRAAEARHMDKGQHDRAAFRREGAEKAEKLARKHGRAAKRFQAAAARARTARRLNDTASAERVAQAERTAAETPQPVILSEKEQRRQDKQDAKRTRLLREGDVTGRIDRKSAQVDYDPRTAAAQREFQIRGPSGFKRGVLADYGSLIARQSDRWPERLLAMEKFDTLCHRALMGEIPAMKYERGVDTSRGPADVENDRAAAHQMRDALRRDIGIEAEAILFHRVHERRTLAWMEGQGMGEAERLGVLFVAAVDAAARHFGLSRPSRAVEAMEERLVAS